MRLLLDTHVLLWAAAGSSRLSGTARALLEDTGNTLHFSAASLWEITIKRALGREDFRVDPARLLRGLLENGYLEVPVSARHAIAVEDLPALHKDPFDSLLIAQAKVEAFTLVTGDATLASYPGNIRLV